MTARVEIRRDMETLVPEWDLLARRTDANPFLWPGWIDAWWRAFGTGRLEILTVREDDYLTGVLPLYRLRGALRSTTNPHTPQFGFLAADDTVVKQLTYALFASTPRRIDLSFLPSTDASLPLIQGAAETARFGVVTESAEAAPYVATDGPWDAYESGLRRKFRSELRRRRRRLEEEGELVLEVSDGTNKLNELLEEGFRIEGSGWKDEYGTSIRSSSATRRFYTEVAQWAAERGWLRLAFLRLDGRAIAFDYCLERNKTHYLLKTGYDPGYRKFAPGMVIRHLMLVRAFSNAIATYDFLGLGSDASWKREWTNASQEQMFLHLFAPTPLGLLDRAVFMVTRAASEGTKNFERNSALGKRALHLVKRGRSKVYERLER